MRFGFIVGQRPALNRFGRQYDQIRATLYREERGVSSQWFWIEGKYAADVRSNSIHSAPSSLGIEETAGQIQALEYKPCIKALPARNELFLWNARGTTQSIDFALRKVDPIVRLATALVDARITVDMETQVADIRNA